jgi:hypothetical protein
MEAFNHHRGTQTVTEGTDAIVHLATLPRPAPHRNSRAGEPGFLDAAFTHA